MRPPRRHRRATVFVASLLALATVSGPAFASMSATTSTYSSSISTGTLAAPTGVAAARGSCTILTSTSVTVTWTQTTSSFADGYQILRSTTNGSGYGVVGTVAGRGTTSFADTTVTFSTTYYYVVRATRNAWQSGNSNQASVTTPTVLCV
jgi:hypothetical protein